MHRAPVGVAVGCIFSQLKIVEGSFAAVDGAGELVVEVWAMRLKQRLAKTVEQRSIFIVFGLHVVGLRHEITPAASESQSKSLSRLPLSASCLAGFRRGPAQPGGGEPKCAACEA